MKTELQRIQEELQDIAHRLQVAIDREEDREEGVARYHTGGKTYKFVLDTGSSCYNCAFYEDDDACSDVECTGGHWEEV